VGMYVPHVGAGAGVSNEHEHVESCSCACASCTANAAMPHAHARAASCGYGMWNVVMWSCGMAGGCCCCWLLSHVLLLGLGWHVAWVEYITHLCIANCELYVRMSSICYSPSTAQRGSLRS
jgi:hypothetical protein